MGTNYYWKQTVGGEGQHIGKVSWLGLELGAQFSYDIDPDDVWRAGAPFKDSAETVVVDEYGVEITWDAFVKMLLTCRIETGSTGQNFT